MKTTLKNKEGLRHEFTVEVPAATFINRKEAELKKIGAQAKIEGFRPGKAPMTVLKKRYGNNATADVLDKIVQESLNLAITENKLRPATEPKIVGVETFEEGKDLKYGFTLEVLPEVPEYDFSKIKLEKEVVEIAEDEVKKALEEVASTNKSFTKIEKARKAKTGDQVIFDFTGRKDGVEFDGGKAEGFNLELGSGQFIPGFEEQMIGMEQGEEKAFPITFPKEYHSADLAGQETEFTVKIQEIQEAGKTEINDELAVKLGLKDLGELKKNIKDVIGRELDQVSRTKLRKELFDKLDAMDKFEVPETVVERDFNQVVQQMKQETPDLDEKEIEVEARALAERRVRLGLVLSDIAKKNKIAPTEEELRQAVFAKAQSMPQQAQQIFEFYQKNPQAQEMLQGELLEDKVVDFIISKADVSEKKVSREELLAEEHVHDENCNHDEKPKKAKKPAAKKETKKKA